MKNKDILLDSTYTAQCRPNQTTYDLDLTTEQILNNAVLEY